MGLSFHFITADGDHTEFYISANVATFHSLWRIRTVDNPLMICLNHHPCQLSVSFVIANYGTVINNDLIGDFESPRCSFLKRHRLRPVSSREFSSTRNRVIDGPPCSGPPCANMAHHAHRADVDRLGRPFDFVTFCNRLIRRSTFDACKGVVKGCSVWEQRVQCPMQRDEFYRFQVKPNQLVYIHRFICTPSIM